MLMIAFGVMGCVYCAQPACGGPKGHRMFPQTDTIRNGRYDLRRTLAVRRDLIAFSDGEEEEDDDESENDDAGDGDEGEKGSSGTDTGDEKSKTRDPEAKAKSREAAKYRNERNAERKRAAELEAELQAFKDKDKSELDIAKRDIDALRAENESLKAEADTLRRGNAFITSGAAKLTNDPELLLKILKLDDLEPDDDGQLDAAEILSRTEELLKSKPHLKADGASDEGDEEKTPSGRPNNGRKGPKKDDQKAQLLKKFPALAGR